MRRGSTAGTLFLNFAVVFCALALIIALVALGTGLLSLFAVFAFLGILTFRPLFERSPAPAYVRRGSRRYSTRSPPRF
jgi:hypothetical protein